MQLWKWFWFIGLATMPLMGRCEQGVHMHPMPGKRMQQANRFDDVTDLSISDRVFQIPLDPAGKITYSWRLDYPRETLSLEVHVPLKAAQWFAVGFSDYGEPFPADYCVMWSDWRGRRFLQDTCADDSGRLSVDPEQDCLNFRYALHGNITKFFFTRKFDTCDPNDYVIEEGTTHIVWALGRGPLYALDGVNVSRAENKGMQRTQLLKNLKRPPAHPEGVWHFEARAANVSVPSDETTYWCQIDKLPEQVQKTKQHLIEFEPVISPGNEGLVHHMELFHCEAPIDVVMPPYKGNCFAPDRPEPTMVCKKVIAAWAMGATPFSYPEEAGLPIGGPEYNLYVMLEVHYNNPENKDDWIDNSGIMIHVTDKLRKYDSGVTELGLEYSDKMAIPPGQQRFTLHGFCISECTAVAVPATGITAFGSQLHTHLTGVQVVTKHIRNGGELPEINRDNHYSTHFQEIRLLKRPVKILPGDALITSCTYKTTDRENITLGGHGIKDEMCVNYMYYYPKIDLEVCKSNINTERLQDYFHFMHRWERQDSNNEQDGISSQYHSINWTPLRANVLHEYYLKAPLSMQCNKSSGDRFPGNWENLPPTYYIPLREPVKRPSCSPTLFSEIAEQESDDEENEYEGENHEEPGTKEMSSRKLQDILLMMLKQKKI